VRWYWALVWAHGQTASGTNPGESKVGVGAGTAMVGGTGGRTYHMVAPNRFY
jgi:hypothetical protein